MFCDCYRILSFFYFFLLLFFISVRKNIFIKDLHGFNLLASKISSEYDKLLEQVDIWENVKKDKAPMAERIKLASIYGVLERIQGKRAFYFLFIISMSHNLYKLLFLF